MPVWDVSEPYISLWLHDEPLGYKPAIGSRIAFKLDYKQRESVNGFNTNFFGAGKKWDFQWFSCVTRDVNGSNVVLLPDGGQITFASTNDPVTDTRLTGNTNSGFTLTSADGSEEVYDFVVTNSAGDFQEAFLSQAVNSQGRETTFDYYNYDPANPVVRLQYVIDGDGRTNSVYYETNNPYSTNLISQVTDPFGRSCYLGYNTNGDLTNITDTASNSTALAYDSGTNDWVTSMTTPYGTTSFSFNDTYPDPEGRSILIAQPDGGHELYLNWNNAAGVAGSYPSAEIPNTGSFPNTFDTSQLNLRDTFYWGPRQYAALSTTMISGFTANDFLKARMRHWLLDASNNVSGTMSMEREPSPDAGGTIEGQKTWYDYAGKTTSAVEGTQDQPLFAARVLPDGTTAFTYAERNSFGAVTNEVSTYSEGNAVLLRTNTFVYGANGIDLLMETNAIGAQVSSNAYNAFHEVVTNFNALNQMTVYTYDGSSRLTSVTTPNGLVTTNVYGSDDFLARQIVQGFTTNSYTYADDLVLTHTDPRGLTTTDTWDALNRLTSTIFPDGTTVSNRYTILDLTGTKDRLGNWTHYGYDNMRRKIAETNADNAVTLYSYCTCGALDLIEDADGNPTSFNYDNQGNLTNTVYADNYSVTDTYNLLRQLVVTSDSGGNAVTNWYDNQGLVYAVSNAFGRVQFTAYDALDRPTNSVDANGVSITNTYDDLDRLLTRGYPDGGAEGWGYTPDISGPTSYTNQIGKVTLYGYDPLGRKTVETNALNFVTSFGYDGAGDLLSLTDGNGHVTGWLYDSYGRVTNKFDADNNLIFAYQYDDDNRLTNRWTPAKGNTVYSYDAVGNLTNVAHADSPALGFSYDPMNRLTNMVDGVGTTIYGYDAAGQLLSEDGPWPDDTVSYTHQNRERTGMSIEAPNADAWTQSYAYDSARRLKGVTSPAGEFDYAYDPAKQGEMDKLSLPGGGYITNFYDPVARLEGTYLNNSSGTDLDSCVYTYDLAGERTNAVRTAGDRARYLYDNAGQLNRIIGYDTNNVLRNFEQFIYYHDAAGNLTQRRQTIAGSGEVNYGINSLNEITNDVLGGVSGFSWASTICVSGSTTSPATNVTVNTSNATLYADNSFGLTGVAVSNGLNTFTAIASDAYGRHSTNVSSVNAVLTNSAYSYDLNGNLLSDGVRNFAYDDENELVAVWENDAWSNRFVYDGKMRRRITDEYGWNGGTSSWQLTNEIRYIYDGNVVIQRRDASNLPTVTYTRGNDLSGSLQGAGGVGGLLARTEMGKLTIGDSFATALYHADGNGNITAMIYSNQLVAAKYLYDPYGNVLAMSGPLAGANTYRFSSKEWDGEAGLYYYGRRFYDPGLQRFVNRDPLGKQGGLNLYEAVGNNPINLYDDLGLMPCWLQNLLNALSGPGDSGYTPLYDPNNPDNLLNPLSPYYIDPNLVNNNLSWNTPDQTPTTGQLFGNGLNNTVSAIGQSMGQGLYDLTQLTWSQNAYDQIRNRMYSVNTPANPAATPYIETSLGVSGAAALTAGAVIGAQAAGYDSLFGRGGTGLLNSNDYLRIGNGWNNNIRQEVFRIAVGNKNAIIHWHFDLW